MKNNKQNTTRKQVCAICGSLLGPFGGNNPDPLFPDNESAQVCTECNEIYVWPARCFQNSHPDAGRAVFRKKTQSILRRA